jgi:hypothetical protein
VTIAGIGLDDKGNEENTRSDEDKMRMGHSCLLFSKAELGIYIV